MSLENGSGGNGMVMPVSPMMGGYGGYGGGFGSFGGDGWWVLLFLLAMGGGWGGFGMGGFGGMMGMADGVLPYFYNTQTQNDVNRGFDNQQLSNQIQMVQDSVNEQGTRSQLSDIHSSINNGFASAEIAACGRAADAMQTAYSNQIASMNQRFADSQNLTGHLNDLAMGLQNCCCENRAATADLKYTVATEACADRAAISDALKDVIAANTASTQKILDQLCQDKIDAKNEKIQELQNQLNMATLRESQVTQNAFISQGFANEVDALYNRLNTCPVPTTPVYGRTPIFTCNNNGCGCGCGSNF